MGCSKRARGFTYLALLMLVATIGIALAGVGVYTSTALQREREVELLFIGKQFREAIRSYYDRSSGAKVFPKSLDELLLDKRFPTPVRHLRQIYRDPMTGQADWVLVRAADGAILGVHSRSTKRPFKVDNFALEDGALAGAKTYADWRFVTAAGSAQAVAAPVVPSVGIATPLKPLVPPPPAAQPVTSPTMTVDIGTVRPELRTRIPPEREPCKQLVTIDTQRCQRVAGARGAQAGEACITSADARIVACNGAQALPPLNVGQ